MKTEFSQQELVVYREIIRSVGVRAYSSSPNPKSGGRNLALFAKAVVEELHRRESVTRHSSIRTTTQPRDAHGKFAQRISS